MASLVGQIVQGRYRVTGRLGAGAMGTAYLAVDERGFERRVVLKVPQTDLLADEAIRKRFAREAQLLLTLKHPHIVNAFEVGEIPTADGGTVPFVAMPYFEAGSLKERLRVLGGVASASEVAAWLPGLADALDYLHGHGVLHRDVKPANILFDQSNRSYAYLADFGIAKALSGDAVSSLSVDGSVASAAYAPPEAWTSAWNSAFDQYSLAVVVFEALSGELPHVPVDSILALHTAKLKPARLLADVAPAVSRAVSQVLAQALATDPAKRYSSCRAFAEALGRAVEGKARVEQPATEPRPESRVSKPPTPPDCLATSEDKPSLRLAKRPASAAVVVAVVALFLSGSTYYFWPTDPRSPLRPVVSPNIAASGVTEALPASTPTGSAKPSARTLALTESRPTTAAAGGNDPLPSASIAISVDTRTLVTVNGRDIGALLPDSTTKVDVPPGDVTIVAETFSGGNTSPLSTIDRRVVKVANGKTEQVSILLAKRAARTWFDAALVMHPGNTRNYELDESLQALRKANALLPADLAAYQKAQVSRPVSGDIAPARKIVDVRPIYPPEALAAHVSGIVIVEATIDIDGRVQDARVTRSVPLLDKAATEAVRQWRFEPTRLNGVAVPIVMTFTVNFELQARDLRNAVLTGTVVDEQGGPLPGVTVELWDTSQSSPRHVTVTDSNGRFAARALPGGSYSGTATLEGWRRLSLPVTPLAPGQSADLGRLTMTIQRQ